MDFVFERFIIQRCNIIEVSMR